MLRLVPRTRDEVKSTIDAMDESVRAQISRDWWAKFEASAQHDPWIHGFNLLRSDGTNVGMGSYKGPPEDGMVEIAYAILPEHQGRGYATAAARLMVEHAFKSAEVRVVRAHTLPGGVVSQRVLRKSGFTHLGEHVDPEDGLVWRFEIARSPG